MPFSPWQIPLCLLGGGTVENKLNNLNSHQFTLTPALSLFWALPVWMQKQQHSLNYVVYQSWGFCIALYSSKALSTEFLDTLTQILQHEPVEQNPCMPHVCHTFCLCNQKQIPSRSCSEKSAIQDLHYWLTVYVLDLWGQQGVCFTSLISAPSTLWARVKICPFYYSANLWDLLGSSLYIPRICICLSILVGMTLLI